MRGAGHHSLRSTNADSGRTDAAFSSQHRLLPILSDGFRHSGIAQHPAALSQALLLICGCMIKKSIRYLYISKENSTFASAIEDGSVAQLDRATAF